jgi:hypothetical protein
LTSLPSSLACPSNLLFPPTKFGFVVASFNTRRLSLVSLSLVRGEAS